MLGPNSRSDDALSHGILPGTEPQQGLQPLHRAAVARLASMHREHVHDIGNRGRSISGHRFSTTLSESHDAWVSVFTAAEWHLSAAT